MSVKIGQRNRLVNIEKRETGVDEANFPTQTWVLHKKKWVEFRAPTGLGSINAAATNGTGISGAQVAYSLRGSYDLSVDQDMRVDYRGQIFEIKQVVHDIAKREYSDIVVVEGGGNG